MLEGKPKAYEDKVMDATPLAPAPALGSPSENEEGVRSFLSETRVGVGRSDSGLELRKSTELGQRFEYRRETLNYGDLGIQADLRGSRGDDLGFGSGPRTSQPTSERLTLRSIGLPLTTRVFADTAVGDTGSDITDALARSYRVSLGNSTVRGASTRIFSETTDVRLGTGQRGTLAGGPYAGFDATEGSMSWAGASRRLGDRVTVGAQASRATEVPLTSLNLFGLHATVDSVATAATYGPELLRDGDYRARGMYVHSHTNAGRDASSQGIFLEGAARVGNARHEFGAYQAEPNLRFGEYQLASDTRGTYWRVDSTALRLNWGGGVDLQETNPDHSAERVHQRSINLSANAQYRIDRDRMIGGSAVVLNSRREAFGDLGTGGDTRSLYASAFYQDRIRGYGRSRLHATVYRNQTLVANDAPATGEQVEWEQEWIEGSYETAHPEVSTTLGVARDTSSGVASLSPTAGVNFRVWPAPDWTVSGNLRYTASNSNLATSRGLSGTLDAERTLPAGWVMGASVSLNQATVDAMQAGLGSPVVSRSNDKFASLYLRWEGVSGTSYRAAGMGNSVGGGAVTGVVFFDANRDGEQQSGETGVPNVEVLLDGRYRATTDRTGRFIFPLVGTGHHQITLTLETVPLPWGAAADRGINVDVPLRGTADTRIPVVRVGE